MKTKKILATVAAFIVAATVLSAAVLATSLPSARPEVTPPAQIQAPASVIAPATPASAEIATPAATSDRSILREHRHLSGDYEWVHALDVLYEECRLAEVARRECTHENSISYKDTDTGVCAAFCKFCGVTRELDEVPADAIITNAATRDICSHTYCSWSYADATTHSRMCSKCSDFQFAYHNRVDATCTTNEICKVCKGRDSSWGMAYGHDMAYVVCLDNLDEYGYDDPNNYYHDYRCVRTNEEGRYICNYVPSSDYCTFEEVFWDSEVNGEHEVYYVCYLCLVSYYEEPDACPRALYGGFCPKCFNPHPYS